jgi:hypothetical protein
MSDVPVDGTVAEPVPASEFTARLVDALVTAVENASSPEIMAAQALMIRRLALAGDVAPSRLPAPRNITEIGGYLNLLKREGETELRSQMLASVLGVAGPHPPLGLVSATPPLFFVTRVNDRPAGAAQATIPTNVQMRSDFSTMFEIAMQAVHELGCTIPLLSANRTLPSPEVAPASDLLGYVGRRLELMPTTALLAPDTDPLALARLTAGGPLQVVARQIDPAAPLAASVVQQDWTAWTCTTTSCTESAALRTYLELTPILNGAGWYQPAPMAPTTSLTPGAWNVWTNVTGLVPGITTLETELRSLFTHGAIVASSVRDRLTWVWDGAQFVAPA